MRLAALHTSERRLRAAETATIIARLAIVVLLLWVASSSSGTQRRVEEAQAAFHRIELTERDILDARANHHAFMLTEDTIVRAAYEAAATRTRVDLTVLDSLTHAVPAQRARLDSVRASLASLTHLRDATMGMHAVTTAQARAVLDSPERIGARATITRLLRDMAAHEQQRITDTDAVRHRNIRVQGLCALIAIVITGIVGMATLRFRRQRSAVLHASETSFRSLAQANPDCVLVHRDGDIVFLNDAALAAFCGTVRPVESLTVFDIGHPDDHEIIRERTAHVTDRQQPTDARVIRFVRHDGSVMEAEARGAPIVFDGQAAIQVVLRDMTNRREAERALALSEERFRAVLDAMTEGVVLQDANLTIQLCNPAAERILGLTHDQMAGRTSFDPSWRAIDEEGEPLPGNRHMAGIALRTGQPASGVMGVERGDAERVWIAVNAVPLFRSGATAPHAVVVTFEDITRQRLASEALRDSEERYRLLADNSADLISLRSNDLRFEYASPSHCAVLGWTPEELVGRSTLDLVHPDDVERITAARAAGTRDGAPVVVTERVLHKDGHWVWLEAASTVLRAADGHPQGMLVSARDITARRTLEDELHQSQKMQVLGRMASGVAHDFNNLLTIIRSSSELLRLDLASQPMALQTIADIELATDRASAMTAHLLTFSRRQHSAPAVMQPARLLQDSSPLLRRIAGEQVTVSIVVQPEVTPEWIRADAIRLEQVLANLVGNARDAMPGGGMIRIRCEIVDLAETTSHRFGVITPGRYLRLVVEDNGSGMSDEVLANLFDPFFTTKPHGRGTGLGLSIVHGIVHEAQGTITVTSEPGFGSCFTIYWPTVDAPAAPDTRLPVAPPAAPLAVPAASLAAAAPSARPAPTAAPAPPRRAVLLVDDDDSVRRVLGKQLETGGYDVRVAGSGAEALEILRAHAPSLHALVTDVRMPGMSGIELLESMLAEQIDLPALVVSGQMDKPLPRSWPPQAIIRFLAKPISGVSLRRTVDAMIAEHAEMREVATLG